MHLLINTVFTRFQYIVHKTKHACLCYFKNTNLRDLLIPINVKLIQKQFLRPLFNHRYIICEFNKTNRVFRGLKILHRNTETIQLYYYYVFNFPKIMPLLYDSNIVQFVILYSVKS